MEASALGPGLLPTPSRVCPLVWAVGGGHARVPEWLSQQELSGGQRANSEAACSAVGTRFQGGGRELYTPRAGGREALVTLGSAVLSPVVVQADQRGGAVTGQDVCRCREKADGDGAGGGVVRTGVCFLDPGPVNSSLYDPCRVAASSGVQPSLDVVRPREQRPGA